jgi:MOSC domain-containing protein YiiM
MSAHERIQSAHGVLLAISLRPARGAPCVAVAEVEARESRGLVGDRRMQSRKGGKRQVTLVRAEDLEAARAEFGREIDHLRVRRNLLVRGLPMQALLFGRIRIGDVVLQGHGECEPCQKMNAIFGPGAEQALAERGGVVASVVTGGRLTCGDAIEVLEAGVSPPRASPAGWIARKGE